MEELYDLLNSQNVSNENKLTSNYNQIADTSFQKLGNIIDELCQLTPAGQVPAPCNDENAEELAQTLQDPPVLEEILGKDESQIPATPANVAILNVACQQVLKDMEQQLLWLLKQNRKEQDFVQTFLTTNGKISDAPKKINVKCAGMPYFKDLNGYPPPQNKDVLRKKKNEKLIPAEFIENSLAWSSNDAVTLVKAVNSNRNSQSSSEPDWMKISVTDMNGKYSPSECKSKWLMNLSPDVNKSKWSAKEIKSLELLAEKFSYQDWDTIAKELGTNRTCLQCCVQYQAHKPPSEGKWSKEEDEALKNLIEKYRVRDYIPWTKVTWHFERRSLRQCQERYAYHLVDIKRGNFTVEEDFVLTYLASKLKNFGEVAKFLPKRVSTQVRSRYEYLVKVSMPEFTKEEDKLLAELMVKYPRNWSMISEFFLERSKVQCRKRWTCLQKSIKPSDDLTEVSEPEESEPAKPVGKTKTKDAANVMKNLLLRPVFKNRKYPEQYSRLLDYHKHCYKFLFGPKPKILSSQGEIEKLSRKTVVTMRYLSAGAPSNFEPTSLLSNPEFSNEDVTVLNEIRNLLPGGKEFEITGKIIPPNYMTLVGLRTLFLSWDRTRSLCHFHKPPEPPKTDVERLLGSDAKKLFKARMKSLFAFPLILSNIKPTQPRERTAVPVSKSKKKSKPLSKRKRKEHSKLMKQAYREKVGKLNDGRLALDEEEILKDLNVEKTSRKPGKKRRRPPDQTPPVKRSKRNKN